MGIWRSRQTTALPSWPSVFRLVVRPRRKDIQAILRHSNVGLTINVLHQERHVVASERNGRAQCEARSGNFQQPSNEQPEACELRERNRLW